MTWSISGMNLPEITVEADSFDEAIGEARKIAKEYYGGQIKEEEEKR